MYATPLTTLPDLEHRIRTALQSIPIDFLRNGHRETVTRVFKCRDYNGGRIEHY